MNTTRTRWLLPLILLVLFAANIGIAYAIFAPHHGTLCVSFLNVGQGDSILIQSPTGSTMVIDGGPDRSVLRELSSELSPLDRSIDLVVETHPDSDHITGLVSVFDQYQVRSFMEPGIPDETAISKQLGEAVRNEPGIQHLFARRGMRIHLGGGAYADVLYPFGDVSTLKATNDGSVVLHVVYGSTSFMLTGDLPSFFEDKLEVVDKSDGELASTVLKAGHHGSKYSTDDGWLKSVSPATVVISAGKDNRYGHPAPETITRIEHEGAKIVSTTDAGTIDFVSDGKTVVQK